MLRHGWTLRHCYMLRHGLGGIGAAGYATLTNFLAMPTSSSAVYERPRSIGRKTPWAWSLAIITSRPVMLHPFSCGV